MAADSKPLPLPSERSFGIFFAIVFTIAASALAWYDRHIWAGLCLVFAMLFALLAAVAPRLLAHPNRLWFRFGLLLHAVVSPIVLGAIFFLIITPIAVVMRLAGRDALERRREPARSSYWKERDPPGPPPDSFRNRF